MSEALALRGKGPSGARRAALCALAVAAGLAPACAPPAAPLPAVPPGVAPSPDAERLAELLSELAKPGAPDSVAATSMRASGLTPPFERRFILQSLDGALVAGLLPGGHPVYRDSLVVVVAAGSAAGAALLEASRLLAERAAFQTGPALTVLAALPVTRGAIEADAQTGLIRALAAPLWDPASISRVVAVGDNPIAALAALDERDLPLTALRVQPGEVLSDLSLRIYAAMTDAASPQVGVARDTVAAQEGR